MNRELTGFRIFFKPWLACLLGLAVLLSGCGKPRQSPTPAPPEVTVSSPRQEPVTDCLDLTGTVSSSRVVDLVARVAGYLQSVHFVDGAMVEEGQLLFVIEPDLYKQQLALAEAGLSRAQSEYDRQAGLIKENATSTANVERWLSERDQARAQVELARINLGYTEVRAPFSGRISRRLVDPGNLVGPTVNTKLATLEQIVPIYVYFNLNERDALRLAAAMRERGFVERSSVGKAPVLIGLQTQEGYPQAGILDYVDIGINPSSGTVQMRAIVQNQQHTLAPGAFARVRIPFGDGQPMWVVPGSAIGNDQEGDYVLVVDKGDVVVRKAVVKGPLTGNGCAIRSGITGEDRVIVNGLMRARPGTTVKPVTEAVGGAASASSSR